MATVLGRVDGVRVVANMYDGLMAEGMPINPDEKRAILDQCESAIESQTGVLLLLCDTCTRVYIYVWVWVGE